MALVLTHSNTGIDYSTVAPLNFAHKTKIWEFNPIGTFSNSLNSNDVARFNIASDHYWDPWSAFIDLTIDVSANDLLKDETTGKKFTNKLLQLDSSAQSFFKSLVITENSVELERIGDIDVLASWLKDVSYNTDDRYQRDYEGLGGATGTSFHSGTFVQQNTPLLGKDAKTRLPQKYWVPSRDLNSYRDDQSNPAVHWIDADEQDADKASYTLQQGEYYTRNHVQNMTQSSFQPCYGWRNVVAHNGANADVPNEYVTNFSDNGVTDDDKRNKYHPRLIGPSVPYSPAFALNGFEPILSRTVNQRFLKNGFVSVDQIVSLNFQIPLMSCHFGHLVAPNNYKLIPLKYFRDLVFEFQFSPHALFTSWWNTDSSARQYTVKSLKLRTELVQITDPAIIAQHDAVYNNGGIRIPTQGYYQGPGYQIVNGAVPPTLQINLGFESLRTVLFGFQPNDHTMNTCCRKQYRLSMAITSMNLKVGTDHYPQIPITGNGGTNIGPLNNNEFLKYLWKAFTKLANPGNSIINPHNFAVNCRAVNPQDPDTDPALANNSQMCYFEENRVIGKAIYAIPLDALNYQNTLLSGLNTTGARPFELNLTCDNSRTFNRSVQMYTYFFHDCVLYIGPDGVKVHGRS